MRRRVVKYKESGKEKKKLKKKKYTLIYYTRYVIIYIFYGRLKWPIVPDRGREKKKSH